MTSAYKDTNYQATSKKSRKINVNPNKKENSFIQNDQTNTI